MGACSRPGGCTSWGAGARTTLPRCRRCRSFSGEEHIGARSSLLQRHASNSSWTTQHMTECYCQQIVTLIGIENILCMFSNFLRCMFYRPDWLTLYFSKTLCMF